MTTRKLFTQELKALCDSLEEMGNMVEASLNNLFFAIENNGELNLDYYNEALISLANAETWFIVHPVTDEKTTTNLLLSALKLNNTIKDIFILDKDINTRENFRSLFSSINKEARINIQISALEDFLNLVR